MVRHDQTAVKEIWRERFRRIAAPSRLSTFANPALKGRLSAVLREQLLNQLNEIDSAEGAAIWARRILPAKNSLNAADARQLEDAFQAKLAELNDRAGDKETASPAFRSISASRSSDEATTAEVNQDVGWRKHRQKRISAPRATPDSRP